MNVILLLMLAVAAVLPAQAAKTKPNLWVPDLAHPWMPTTAQTQHRPAPRPAVEAVSGFLFVEAEDFADYGAWRLDTQFTHKMGSGR